MIDVIFKWTIFILFYFACLFGNYALIEKTSLNITSPFREVVIVQGAVFEAILFVVILT